MDVTLAPYGNEADTAIKLIIQFWQAHNHETPKLEEAAEDLTRWTKEGHRLYFIRYGGEAVGFVHLGSRGGEIDWLEELFVLPEFQGRGIGTRAIGLAEKIVSAYSESFYIEAAARNEKAIRLYRKLGYDCLNTVTIRKDFHAERFETLSTERILDMDFQIKRYRK